MTTTRRRTGPRTLVALLLMAASLAGVVVGLLSWAGASMPYPDATPELLARQAADRRWALTVLVTACLLALASGLWLWRARRRRG